VKILNKMQKTLLTDIYDEKLKFFTKKLNKAKVINRNLAVLRGLTFVSAIIISIIIFDYGLIILFVQIIIFISILLFFVRKNIRNQNYINYLKETIIILKNEISALNYDFSNFGNGNEFINPDHKFSYDLDIFGENSIFQMLNRTCTNKGNEILAEWFQNPEKNCDVIKNRQIAIYELENEFEWRINFLATGNLFKEDFVDNNNIKKLTETSDYFHNRKFYKIIRYLFPVITVMALILSILDLLPYSIFGVLYSIQFGLIGINIKKSNEIHSKVTKKIKLFEKYELLLKEIETLNSNSELILFLKEKIKTSEKTASTHINKLKKLSKGFDNRLNLLFTLFAQGFILWDLQYSIEIEKWQYEHNKDIEKWIEVIGEFDALISLSMFAFNNPEYIFPESQKSENFIFEIEDAGHPLIHKEKLIKNDFSISKHGFITIVTGANMAGKSTFLRTVGVNLIMGMIGSKVCARKFKFTPIQLFTSVRTSDSIQKNESYFYAELKRLKAIIEELKQGTQLFVIIDEMLRGTNSKDKHLGSEAMIIRLFTLNSVGIVATHDIDFGKLSIEYPDNVQNKRFEVDIKENELYFDYKIKDGISQNLNATFLMKKMEIII
jgi:hypothetical protein